LGSKKILDKYFHIVKGRKNFAFVDQEGQTVSLIRLESSFPVTCYPGSRGPSPRYSKKLGRKGQTISKPTTELDDLFDLFS